ncbi:MAG: glycosyltransferase family 39 protein [Thermodesulfobacteriota bacterium]|jgi:uncharacterized membrane protein
MMGINLSGMKKIIRKEFFILILCLLIGFALRFYTFDQKSLWIDEIHTYNDSRDDFRGQLKFYEKNPTYLHPPGFFILTHLFYPFTKPERDLRIIPLIFGTLSIPMIYFLARSFSPSIALPCTLSLTFMAYHIAISQDGRSYSLLMFLGMVGLYFLMKHIKTSKRRYLLLVGIIFAALFHTSYSSISFIALSQSLFFYLTNENDKKPGLSSFLVLNSTILLISIPWILFIALNYKGEPMVDPLSSQVIGSFWNILYGIFNDWVPHIPLTIISIILLILFPIISKHRKNALILLTVFFFPIGGIYLFCKLFYIEHFFNSRYFINFLPLFLISIYLSLDCIEVKFKMLKRFSRLRLLFVILFIASNMIIFPLYYRSEKQDFRRLVSYLDGQLQDKDKIFVKSIAYIPGMLHYFGVNPKSRHYNIPFGWDSSGKSIEFRISLISHNRVFTIYHADTCCAQYISEGNRLWIVAGKPAVKEIKQSLPCVLKGYFDGTVANFRSFPSDASMYLFLWDPQSQDKKGIDMPIE